MKKVIEKYIKNGVHQNKIITTKQPSIVIWSKSRKCIVGGDSGIEPLEIINGKITYENNYMVSMQIRTINR